MAVGRTFNSDAVRHQNLLLALRDQITSRTPLKSLLEDGKIGSDDRFLIDEEAKSRIDKCLSNKQKRDLHNDKVVSVLGYDEDGKSRTMELRKEYSHGGTYVFEGPWADVMNETRSITVWGLATITTPFPPPKMAPFSENEFHENEEK